VEGPKAPRIRVTGLPGDRSAGTKACTTVWVMMLFPGRVILIAGVLSEEADEGGGRPAVAEEGGVSWRRKVGSAMKPRQPCALFL
jgi:hypothetical protein